MKVLETQHRPRQSLDTSVVLFNDIVEVFALADFYACMIVSIHLVQARLVRTTLIDIHLSLMAFFKKRKAACVSRVAVKRKSMVFPCLSMAR